jgi:Cu-Zn family superoxide dismutase
MYVIATCILQNHKENIYGIVWFQQTINDDHKPENETRVYGTIKGLSDGLHGFHIHTFGDLSNGCDSAGPHFNPTGQDHGSLNSEIRHVGDMGNLESFGGEVSFNFVVKNMSLVGPYSIIGRSVIVHADKDDLGITSNPLSKTTGNAGGRIACGVIGISQMK